MCAVSFVMRVDILFRGSVAVANSACKLLCSAPIGRRHYALMTVVCPSICHVPDS